MRDWGNCISCVILCLLCFGCSSIQSKNIAVKKVNSIRGQDPRKEKPIESVTRIKASLSEAGSSSSWRVEELLTGGREVLRSVYFLDALHGWVGGRGVLYRTADSGKSWLPADISLSPRAVVTQVVFLNPTMGWVIAQEEASTPLKYQENHFWLMHTKDGGQTWSTQLEGQDSVLNRIRFSNEREGWLVGVKYTSLVPLRADDFILHTLDREHWLDVSEPLNQALHDMPIKPGFTDIMPEGPLTASVVLPRGSIFKTDDGGRNWQQLNGTIDDSSYACFCHIGAIDNRNIWAGGDKDDQHSLLGMIAVKENDSWREHILFGVSFADILFLSRSRILTCGSSTPNQKGYTEERYGVISYSSDGGNTWSIIYRNLQAKKINALTPIDSDQVWAVGDDGLILRLEYFSQELAKVP